MPRYLIYLASLLLFASIFLASGVNAQHTVDDLQNTLEALEAAGVNEGSLAQEASKLGRFLRPVKVAGLVPVKLSADAQRVTGGAPAFFFARALYDAINGNRSAEDVKIRNHSLSTKVNRLFPNDKECSRYETLLWDATLKVETATFQHARTSLARALKARGYSLRDAKAFNNSFKEAAVYLKDLSFGPGHAKAVITELEFKDAKGWLVRTSQEESVSSQLIEHFRKAKSEEDLLELVDRLPETTPPKLALFSARKGRTILAGVWSMGNTTMSTVEIVNEKSFLLTWCELDRDRWE